MRIRRRLKPLCNALRHGGPIERNAVVFFFFKESGAPRDLPPSPPRRSPDLWDTARLRRRALREPLAYEKEETRAEEGRAGNGEDPGEDDAPRHAPADGGEAAGSADADDRSEEHTSELQSPCNLVCRLLLEKK